MKLDNMIKVDNMMKPDAISPKLPYILIVDDVLENLQVLATMLKEKGYKVRAVTDGNLALQAIRNEPPCLVLLDINMPEMNGYDVCKRLKVEEASKDIPVIFISAMNETIDKIRAFSVGGVDYITKPFQVEEVLMRVSTHLKLWQQNRLLQESCNQLKKLESMRDNMVDMIVHDLRSPLSAIFGFLDIIQISENLTEEGRNNIRKAKASSETMFNMIRSVLDVSKMEAGAMKIALAPCDLVELAQKVLVKMESLKTTRKVVLNFSDKPAIVNGDAEIISRVIQNLLDNAFKYTTKEHGEIHICIEPGKDYVRVSVQDNGYGIPEAFQSGLFQKFGQVETQSYQKIQSTGIGLYFCKMAVESHGGKIGMESKPGKGSTFWFTIPIMPI